MIVGGETVGIGVRVRFGRCDEGGVYFTGGEGGEFVGVKFYIY